MAADDILGFAIEEEDDFDPVAEGDFTEEDTEPIEDVPQQNEEVPAQVRGRRGAYDADRYDCVENAIEALFKNNAGRRFVMLDIIEFCTNPRTESEVAAFVTERQQANASVYGPATLCRHLERSGALTCEVPETADTVVEDNGVEYLEIKDDAEVVWTSTDAGLHVLANHREGTAVRDLVLGKEPQYEAVYAKLLAFLAEQPRKKAEIDELLQDEPVLQVPPRRAPSHFVDMLEGREGIEWTRAGWTLTEAGRRFYQELCG